jgi:hypothetical protein
MKDFITRNKEERLKKKINKTPEFKAFMIKFDKARKEHPQNRVTKYLMKKIPNTMLAKWLYSKWESVIISEMRITKIYFDRMIKYI